MSPLIPALSVVEVGARESVDIKAALASLQPLANCSDEDALFVFHACADACEHSGDGKEWSSIDQLPGMIDLMKLVTNVIADNFTPLFNLERPHFISQDSGSLNYKPVSMPNGEDWLWRPMLRGCCKGEGYFDGTLRIEHIAKFNDALDVSDENEARARKAAEKNR